MIDRLKLFLEKNGFEVNSRIAHFFGFDVRYIRLFWIYFTFFTFGATAAIYFWFAFILKLKDKVYVKRKSAFDL